MAVGTAQNDGWNLRQHFIDVVGRGCKRKRRVKIVSLRHFNLGNYGATPQPLAESHHRTTQTSNHRQHQFCQYIWKFVCTARRAQIHIHIKATCCAKEKDIHCERNEERHENERDFWRENNSSYHYVHHLFHSGFLFSWFFFFCGRLLLHVDIRVKISYHFLNFPCAGGTQAVLRTHFLQFAVCTMETKSEHQIKLNLAIVAVRVANFSTRVGIPTSIFLSAISRITFLFQLVVMKISPESLSPCPPPLWPTLTSVFRDQLSPLQISC